MIENERKTEKVREKETKSERNKEIVREKESKRRLREIQKERVRKN